MITLFLLDTGPLVAALDRRDIYHAWAVEQFKRLQLPFYTCEAVLTEAVHLLRRARVRPAVLFPLITSGALVIRYDLASDVPQVSRLMERYENRPMSLADACLVRMAERHPHSTVLTADSDFHIYRKHRNKTIPVIVP